MTMDTYYLLLDKDTGRVSVGWKAFHVLMLVLITLSGFITTYLFGNGMKGFGNHCILYAEIAFLGNNTTTELPQRITFNKRLELPDNFKPLDLSSTNWHNIHLCYFCQFMPLTSMISALIWISIFMVCSRGGSGYYTDTYWQPWRIVYPALFYSLVATILMLVSSTELLKGLLAFCAEFDEILNTNSCSSEIDKYTLYFHDKIYTSITLLVSSAICSCLCCLFWFLHTLVLVIRILCIADFRMVQVVITPINIDSESESALGKKLSKLSPGKMVNNSSDIDIFNKPKIEDDQLKSSFYKAPNGQRSPSFNYVDDSPHIEEYDDTDFSLRNMKKHIAKVQSNGYVEKETTFQAPRADLSSI